MIYLAQTDTTAGFLSNDAQEINLAKKRNIEQLCILTSSYFFTQKSLARCPNKYKNFVRKSKKTTFIFPNKTSIRIIKNHKHSDFLKSFIFLYSSSANKHSHKFEQNYATVQASKIVDNNLKEQCSSTIIKINNIVGKKVR